MPYKPNPKPKLILGKRATVKPKPKTIIGKRATVKPKRVVSYPPPMKDKKAPKRETAAKRVVKASTGSAANLARSGEAQRREMARTRLVQQQGRMTAAERRKVTERNKDIKLNKIHRATARINRRSSY
jgi:hypothetical protein